MKNKFLMFMLLISTAFITNCAKSSGSGAAATTTAVATCSAGYVYTPQYNCIPQSTYCTQTFGANYGQYNGQCVAGTQTTMTTTGAFTPGYSASCPAGQVGTAHGCLPQNSCPVGYGYEYGYYNGQMGAWCYPQTY